MEATSTLNLRIATYNILNTKGRFLDIYLLDRYIERERLLKENTYCLNADIIGLQEVVFGPNQLDELSAPSQKVVENSRHTVRHEIDVDALNVSRGSQGYEAVEASIQI